MSDYKYQPAPGATSASGAFMRTPQQPSYYYQDANQYGASGAQAGMQMSAQASAPQTSTLASWVNFSDPGYLKGLALGAGVALVVSNPKVQQAVVSGAVKLWAAIQGGVEEIKEQIQDVKAELSREE
jgi:hypothetical protein